MPPDGGSRRFTSTASAASDVRSTAWSIRRRRPRVLGFFPRSEPANLDDASIPSGSGSNYPQLSISSPPRWSVMVLHGAKRRCRPSRLRRMRMRRPFYGYAHFPPSLGHGTRFDLGGQPTAGLLSSKRSAPQRKPRNTTCPPSARLLHAGDLVIVVCASCARHRQRHRCNSPQPERTKAPPRDPQPR
jgi:hypothetical protein